MVGAQAQAARPLRLVYCGTPQFAVPTLEALIAAGHSVALALTQPDRPSGRGMQLSASPVKAAALAHGIPVRQPETLRTNAGLRAELEAVAPDAIVVVAYGRIVPPWMLALPRLGNINLHGSLLPRYRGAAPVQWAVAHGEPETGVTTMLLNEGLDTGPILERRVVPIAPGAMATDVFEALARAGAPLMLTTLAGLTDGTLTPEPQNDAEASHAPILTREDGRLDTALTAQVCYDRWRGFSPWPGAWALLEGKKFSVTRMAPVTGQHSGAEAPGTLSTDRDRLFLHCAQSTVLELLEVQLEGRRATPAAAFLRGFPQIAGKQLA